MLKFICLIFVGVQLISCVTQPKPVMKNYDCPTKAGAKAGKVSLLVDVDANGKAENIRVVESEPKGDWDETFICVVKQRVFKRNDAGKAPPFKDHKVEFEMKEAN